MSAHEPTMFPDDEQNPYAPPRADIRPELVPAGTTPVRFSIEDALARSWEIFRDRMGICIGALVVYYLLLFAAAIGFAAAMGAVQDPPEAAAVVALLGIPAFFLYVLWISLGLVRVMVDIARGRV